MGITHEHGPHIAHSINMTANRTPLSAKENVAVAAASMSVKVSHPSTSSTNDDLLARIAKLELEVKEKDEQIKEQATATEAKVHDYQDEPILRENNRRFVMFPIE